MVEEARGRGSPVRGGGWKKREVRVLWEVGGGGKKREVGGNPVRGEGGGRSER